MLLAGLVQISEDRVFMHTNTETNDKDRNTEKRDLVSGVKRVGHALNIGGDDGTGKSYDETRKSHHHCTPPLIQLRPIFRILGIVDLESHQLEPVDSARRVCSDPLENTLDRLLGIFCKIGIFAEDSGRKIEKIGLVVVALG